MQSCHICGRVFNTRKLLLQHHGRVHGPKKYECHICGQAFTRKDKYITHQRSHTKRAYSEANHTTAKQLRRDEPVITAQTFTIPQSESMPQSVTIPQPTYRGESSILMQDESVTTHQSEPMTQSATMPQPTYRGESSILMQDESLTAHQSATTPQPEPMTQSATMPQPSTSKGESSILSREKVCNWCGRERPLLPGKPFCQSCGKQGRECSDCHRPLPQRFFVSCPSKCNSCHKKKQQKQTGKGPSTALEGRVQTHTLKPTSTNKNDLLLFFKDNEDAISDILIDQLHQRTGIKWYSVIIVKLVRYTPEGEEMTAETSFRNNNTVTTNISQVEQQIADSFFKIYESFQSYQRDGSGWQLDGILKMEVNTAKYNPIAGSTYIPTPQNLVKKKAVVNVKNDDEYCFVWSVLAHLYPAPNDKPNRLQHYSPYFDTLNLEGLQFPLTLDQVPQFEAQNDLSVNVLGYDRGVFPLYVTDKRCDTHVTLILISKDDVRHYCLVKSLSRLLGDRTEHKCKSYYCDYCLHGFTTEPLLVDHRPRCTPMGLQRTIMPQNQFLQFENIKSQLKVPFIIVCDFECKLTPIKQCTANTTRFEQHEPSGFGYIVISSVPKYSKPPVVYRGSNVVETFLKALQKENDYICKILNEKRPMIITPLQQREFDSATHCHICEKLLGADRVRDHCHITGLYRGPAHNYCNLQYKFRTTTKEEARRFFIPVVLHNCRNYDGHLICSVMGMFRHLKIKCIATNLQKYISFSLGNLRFIDSLQFLNASLETLVANMAKDGSDKFHLLKEHVTDPAQRALLLRKGVYPYSYVTDDSKFSETELPPIEAFYNDLTEQPLSPEDYAHAKSVWAEFDIKNLGEYHDLYLKSDVLLLADVFENFRNICLSFYKLDAAHYYTSPGLSWDSMLRMTGVKLQLLQDINMHLFVEEGIRGGISMISTKFARANNPYLPDFDSSQSTSYITYLDANNLYGWAMSQFLPLKDFAWLNDDQIQLLNVRNIPDQAETGYILEVDLDYPESLHAAHSDYPLCPEAMCVEDCMLSPYSLQLKEELDLKGKPHQKLIPNLRSKKNYVIHYRNLKFCLAQGMVLTKIHRGIEFTQSAWLKTYIDFNTQKRKAAKNDFEKDFFKLLNNAVFGKTMENLRKRTRIELVHDNVKLEKLIAKPSFQAFRIFNPDLCGVHMKKTKLTLDRPIYVGLSILDISKILMYDFHYNYIKPKYGDKAKLLFTDTDSLAYKIQCDDVYSDMKADSDLFDLSNYPKDHALHNPVNAKVLGKMKDETAGEPIQEFVGLRPKMYSILLPSGDEKKTAKGISRYVVKKKLRHHMYKEALFEKRSFTSNMNCIRSFDHQLYTLKQTKTGLSPFDDKRFVLEDGVHTLAHGHFTT